MTGVLLSICFLTAFRTVRRPCMWCKVAFHVYTVWIRMCCGIRPSVCMSIELTEIGSIDVRRRRISVLNVLTSGVDWGQYVDEMECTEDEWRMDTTNTRRK